MASEEKVNHISLPAGADLTTTGLYRFGIIN